MSTVYNGAVNDGLNADASLAAEYFRRDPDNRHSELPELGVHFSHEEALNCTTQPCFIMMQGAVPFFNRSFERVFPRLTEESIVFADDQREFFEFLAGFKMVGEEGAMEVRLKAADGSYHPCLCTIRPLGSSSKEVHCFIGSITDYRLASENQVLTEENKRLAEENRSLKQENAWLKRAKERAEKLLTETFHRTKNGVQKIMGMLDVFATRKGILTRSSLAKVKLMIHGIALLNELMTNQSKRDPKNDLVDLRTFILKHNEILLANLKHPQRFTCEVEEGIRMDSTKVASLMLIMNEFVCNADKHAPGEIQVAIKRVGDTIVFTVRDKGKGFSSDPCDATEDKTGVRTMVELVQWDLGGYVTFANADADGTAFTHPNQAKTQTFTSSPVNETTTVVASPGLITATGNATAPINKGGVVTVIFPYTPPVEDT